LNYKYQNKLIGREFVVLYLGGYYSIQDKISVLPVYSKKAYLQSYSHQVEFYYELTAKIVLSNYFGYDRIKANMQTNLDAVSLLPKDQEGWSYAVGLDFQLSKNTGLYLRQRWFKYEDYNFSLDKYKGMESTVELKIFF
jgi:predicted porin